MEAEMVFHIIKKEKAIYPTNHNPHNHASLQLQSLLFFSHQERKNPRQGLPTNTEHAQKGSGYIRECGARLAIVSGVFAERERE